MGGAGVLSVRPALPVVGQTKGGWGLVVPSLLLYLDRFSGLICRWAVSGAALPQATQQQILVVDGLPAAQGRHEAAQAAGEHQCVQGQPSRNTPVLVSGAASADSRMESLGYRGCSHRQHRPAAAPQAMPLLSTVTMAPPGSAARKRPASPDRSTTAPNTSPSQQPMPQPYRAAPSTMGIRTSEMEKGPKRMALPTNWSIAAMAAKSPPPARYCVVFSYDFPLLPLRRSGCGAFLFDFYRLGQRVTGPLRGR